MFLIDLIKPGLKMHKPGDSAHPVLNSSTTGLFEEILEDGKSLRTRVTGRSMASFINDGDFVVMKKVHWSRLKTGDIIFYRGHAGEYILHRIIKKWKQGNGLYTFQTKGDAMMAYDAPVHAGDILGRIHSLERNRPAGAPRVIDFHSSKWRMINHALAIIHRLRSIFYFKIYSPLKKRSIFH